MSSSEESESEYTPLDIQQVVDNESSCASILLPPLKSRPTYEAAYQRFVRWKQARKKAITSEVCLLDYFEEMDKKYKPTTLWALYSMLKSIINLKENIDIGKFPAVTAFLKNRSRGFQSKKTHGFTSEHIGQFLTEAPDNIFLATKVVLIFGVAGGCRAEELVNVKVQNIEEQGELLLVKISDANKKPRSFVINAEYAKIVKKYQALRPQNVFCDRFFLNYQNQKCTSQVIGKNKMNRMPKQIATYLQLENPEDYTGHALRRSSTNLLTDAGTNMFDPQCQGGWPTTKMAEVYVEGSPSNNIKIESNMILSEIDLPTTSSDDDSVSHCELPLPKRRKYRHTSISDELGRSSLAKAFYLKNCNVTIHYNR